MVHFWCGSRDIQKDFLMNLLHVWKRSGTCCTSHDWWPICVFIASRCKLKTLNIKTILLERIVWLHNWQWMCVLFWLLSIHFTYWLSLERQQVKGCMWWILTDLPIQVADSPAKVHIAGGQLQPYCGKWSLCTCSAGIEPLNSPFFQSIQVLLQGVKDLFTIQWGLFLKPQAISCKLA